MTAHRVVVTGMGLLSPLGIRVSEFWNNLTDGVTGIRSHPNPKIDFPVGWVDFPLEKYFSRAQINTVDRVSLFSLAAAEQAVNQAMPDLQKPLGHDAGVYWGTGMGGADSLEEAYAKFFCVGGERKKVLTVPAAMVHAPASQVALKYGVTGECQTYSTACSSSSVAIGEAYRKIRCGQIQMAVAGGAECLLVPGVLNSWKAMHVMCKVPDDAQGSGCRPFSADRSGFAIGEGAAAFVLETLESALLRGVQPQCELVGFGVSNDATHITKPAFEGQALAMKRALNDAQLMHTQIGYINAHGTATLAGDLAETQSIKSVFAEHAYSLAISGTKSSHGHLMGATGAVEFLAATLSLKNQIIPPTAHWTSRDHRCDLDYVPGKGRLVNDLSYAMSNSFAFGGNNAVLIAKRWQKESQ
jgi:3-oxoacyl-(acyl-carrier-protein) synthase